MILSETDLRNVVRNILEQSSPNLLLTLLLDDILKDPQKYLSSKREKLESLTWKDKKYKALGFLESGIPVALINKTDLKPQDTTTSGAFQLAGHQNIKIINSGLSSQIDLSRYKGSNVIPVTVRKGNKDVKLNFVKVDYGESSKADIAIEVAGVLGAVPLLGEPIDVAAGFIALVKDPPDYVLAALSFICAIPAIGIGASFLKSSKSKIAGKTSKEAIQFLKDTFTSQKIKYDLSINFNDDFRNIWKTFLSPDSDYVQKVSKALLIDEVLLNQRLKKTLEVADEIAQGFQVDNVALKSSQKESLHHAVNVGIKRVLASLESGPLREQCIRFSREISSRRDILTKPPENLIGKFFEFPGIPGKRVLFKDFQDFKKEFFNTYQLLGLKGSQEDFIKFYTDIAEGTLKPVEEENIDLLVSLICNELKTTKMTLTPSTRDAKGVFIFNLNNNLTKIEINAIKFDQSFAIQEILEHEIIHAVDRMILTITAGGDKLSKNIIEKLNLQFSSEMTLGAGSYFFKETDIKRIIDDGNLQALKPWQRFMFINFSNSSRFTNAQIINKLSYISDPTEFFVRAQRISGWLARRGKDKKEWSYFFNKDSEEAIRDLPDSDFFEDFFELFKEEADGTLTPFRADCLKSFKQTLDAAI